MNRTQVLRRAGPSWVLVGLVGLSACKGGGSDWRPTHEPLTAGKDGITRPEPVAFFPANELASSASSDGRYVAFVSDETGNLDVWLRDFRTRSSLPLTKDSADDYDPAFSPDAERVAFVSRRFDAKGDLFIIDADDDDDDPDRLTGPETLDRQPIFSPDGKRLYFTSSAPVGLEHVYSLELDEPVPKRLSPTPGFDPAPSPDGAYLVYTAPEGTSGRAHPHLVLLRLADSATRAITNDDGAAGFARFVSTSTGAQRLVFVRFADDDNSDGYIDGEDTSSLWGLELDPEALLAGRGHAVGPAFPLSSGTRSEIFPDPSGPWLYFTQKARLDQDVVRLPLRGMFPDYENAADYNELAKVLLDPRERWFAYRATLARSEGGDPAHARALLGIANGHLEGGRAELAARAFGELAETTKNRGRSREGELGGIARVELLSLDRKRELARAGTSLFREAVIRDIRASLESIRSDYDWSPSVRARIELESAELVLDRGDRLAAIAAFDRVVERHPDQSYSAAKAMLRRVELLGVAFDPDAIGEAYQQIASRFPGERQWINEAARRTVEAHLRAIQLERDPRPSWSQGEDQSRQADVDALRRVVLRSRPSPVRLLARWRMVEILDELGRLDNATLELAEMVTEAELLGDRLAASIGLATLANFHERNATLDEALATWRRLRSGYGSLPGVSADVRDAITRVAMRKAQGEEDAGNAEGARRSYRAVIDNDLSQVRAHRRYLALSAQVGKLEEALDEARQRAEASPRSPIARYVLGLALSWLPAPDLAEADAELSRAIELNPQLVHAYIGRAWVRENRALAKDNLDYLDAAIADAEKAVRINRESVDLEAEADALLNLANSVWTLGAKTKEAFHVRRAFNLYLERLETGVPFRSKVREALFYERLSRAAAWAQEWALSVTAARDALQLVEEIGLDQRKAQLWGNLALAYTEAQDSARASEAFAQFADSLEARALEQRLVIARRNRAVAGIRAAERDGSADVDASLRELQKARSAIEEGDYSGPKKPFSVVPSVGNASRGPFGLWLETEREVNLWWAERAHRVQGDLSRAREIRAERRVIVAEAAASAGTVTLGVIRELLGAVVLDAKQACEQRDFAACQSDLQAGYEAIAKWKDEGSFEADRDRLILDEARLDAVVLELLASLPEEDRARVSGLAPWIADRIALLPNTETEVRRVLSVERPELETALLEPRDLPFGLALVESATSSADLEGVEGRVPLGVLARLIYARAIFDLARGPAVLDGTGLEGLLGELDRSVDEHRRVLVELDRAARLGALSGTSLGRRVRLRALEAKVTLAAQLLERPGAEAPILSSVREGEGELAEIRLSAIQGLALGGKAAADAERALISIAPLLADGDGALLRSVLTRTTSTSLENERMGSAFDAADRYLAYAATGGRRAVLARPIDVRDDEFIGQLRGLIARLERSEAQTNSNQDAAVEGAGRFVSELKALRDTPISDELGVRLFGEPVGSDFVKESLGPRQVLIMPISIGEDLHVFFVDGSTTTANPFLHAVSKDAARSTFADIASLRSALSLGRAPTAALVEGLDASLLAPFAARLEGKDTVLFADAAIGGPVPAWVLPSLGDRAVAHLSSPTALYAAQSVHIVGESRSVVVAPRDETQKADVRLSPKAALELHELAEERTRAEEDLAPGEGRRLDQRSDAERLSGTAQGLVVVDAPLRLEPEVLERSAIELSGPNVDRVRPEDRFQTELPLGELRLPARLLVLTRVQLSELRRFGRPSGLGKLDVAMAAGGTATTVVMPAGLPEPVRQRLVESLRENYASVGPARALADAIHRERDAHPAVALVTLLGSPGLDAEQAKRVAAKSMSSAMSQAAKLYKKGQFAASVPLLRRTLRLHRAAEAKGVDKVTRALVNALAFAGDFVSAADTQQELIAEMSAQGDGQTVIGAAWVDLGKIYSLARDFEAASKSLDQAIEILQGSGKPAAVAEAHVEVAENNKRRLEYEKAAEAYETAIRLYEKAGYYARSDVPSGPLKVLRLAGELYLNRLSDTNRAKARYERFARLAKDELDRVETTLSLSQVARRGGDFEGAARLAQQAREGAIKAKAPQLEVEALIEATNVSWYQGDYARGLELCQESLRLAEASLQVAQQNKLKVPRREIKAVIFALSACGLLHMSTRDFESATSSLVRASSIARRFNIPSEEAAQYNNLGRVFLEFGRFEEAETTFKQARRIDERLNDRFGLAYDLRNLGTAFAYQRQFQAADESLERALVLSREIKDANNVLRSLFALAEAARARGELDLAKRLYLEALPLADRLEVKELSWQIHRALGLIALAEKDAETGERELRNSIRVVRTLTGRAADATDFGPHRYAAYDDLIVLLTEQDRWDEAFELNEMERALSQTELLDDRRVESRAPGVPAALIELRSAQTSTGSDAAREALSAKMPRLAERFAPVSVDELARQLPVGRAIMSYRMTQNVLVIFVLDASGLTTHRVDVSSSELRRQIGELARGLRERADLTRVLDALSATLIRPIAERLAAVERVVVIPHGTLRYVPFAALGLPSESEPGAMAIDRFTLAIADDARSAVAWLARPVASTSFRSLIALGSGAPEPGSIEAPLSFADKELDVIQEERPRAVLRRNERATGEALLDALESESTLVHFAGHTRLDGRDPLASQLATAKTPVRLYELLGRELRAPLVVLSGCDTLLGVRSALAGGLAGGSDVLSLGQTMQLGGAELIVASSMRVNDVAAALLMKRFHRALKDAEPVEALRRAQIVVRKYEPHASWWATFSVLVR